MSILRGTRKILFAAGLAGCGAAAAVIFTGLNLDGKNFKAFAESNFKFDDKFRDNLRSNHLLHATATPSKWDYNWDRRDPKSLVKPLSGDFGDLPESERDAYEKKVQKARATATRHLLLIRHGQYNLSGASDEARTLTKLGRGQADMLALRLKELNLPYTKIIKSTMKRATETADIIHNHFPDLPTTSCDFIREGSPILPDPPSSTWRPEAKFFEDGARIESAFRKYFYRADPNQKEDSYDIMVCHGNVIRYFVCRALQFPAEGWLRFSLHNCSLTWIAIKPSGRVIVYTVGDTGHMPRDKMTTT